MKSLCIYLKIIFFSFSLFSLTTISGQNFPEPITKAFLTGNCELLSEYFNKRLQVNIIEKEHICSKAQAKEIMREFFIKNKPSSFSIIFEGGKDDSNFAIGSLNTASGNYRVNIFFKKFDNNYLIHLLRIEKDDKRAF